MALPSSKKHEAASIVSQIVHEAISIVSQNNPRSHRHRVPNMKVLMERKEYYRNNLPHFQQPGQSYFVTCCLKSAVPPKALKDYGTQLELLKNNIDFLKNHKASEGKINQIKSEYRIMRKKYIKAYDDLLHEQTDYIVNLSDEQNRKIMFDAFLFWEGNKIENEAFCVMPNHFHWVFHTKETDNEGKLVYLQDVLHSIKSFTAKELNRLANRNGQLWQRESFDTTIRDEKHLYSAIEYTLNNPVAAGYVNNREDWKGNWSR